MATRKTRKRAGKRKQSDLRSHLAPWARDAFGIGLVVVALLSVLALWLSSGGPFGSLLRFLVKGAIGVGSIAFPILALYWGVLLLRDTVREERVRMFIGFVLAAEGALGIVSLVKHDPSPMAGSKLLGHAGGLAGALVAHPLAVVAQTIGATIVCAGFTVLGLLVFTGTPLSAVGHGLHALFFGEREEDEEEEEYEEYDEYDEYEDEEIEPERVIRLEDDPAPELPEAFEED